MNGTNIVAVVGRLTRDAEIKYPGAGMAIASCAVAVSTGRKQPDGSWTDETNFFDVTLLGKAAESLKAYLLKGKQIAVTGHLKQDRWEKEGQKYSKVVIVADSVQLLGGNENGQQSAPQAQQPAGDYQSAGSGDDFPEDLPF